MSFAVLCTQIFGSQTVCEEMTQPLFGTAQIPFSPQPSFRADLSGLTPVSDNDAQRLPTIIPFRSQETSFNSLYDFALLDGRVATRIRKQGIDQQAMDQPNPWYWVPLPDRINGHISSISADDDELCLIGPNGWIYTMDRIFSEAKYWNITNFWGAPFWLGMGRSLPQTRSWSYTVNNRQWDGFIRDTAGKEHTIGGARMTMIAALQGDGSDILMIDPWLYNDDSYRIPAPMGGLF